MMMMLIIRISKHFAQPRTALPTRSIMHCLFGGVCAAASKFKSYDKNRGGGAACATHHILILCDSSSKSVDTGAVN